MKRKVETWNEFFEKLKDGKRMSLNNCKMIKKYLLNFEKSDTIEESMKRYVKKLYTVKQITKILKVNPELIEFFI